MYALIKLKDYVRIPPAKFNKPIESATLEELRAKYEGALINIEVDKNTVSTGIVVAVLDAEVNSLGMLIPGDGALYHRAIFNALVFMPFEKEVIEGEVVSVTRAGIYVNLGVIDGFIHINQVADEKVVFDAARGSLLLEESRKYVEKGDKVRARVYVTGIMPGKGIRIHMTMRQPGMGKL
ncbi:MAG: DNA-directed RNA polymerase [Desulfurococcaceae archaeon]